jgi:hypothetical protein
MATVHTTHCEHELDVEHQISHVIPSFELAGSRIEKIGQLDAVVDHLLRVRRMLAGEQQPHVPGYEGPSRYIDAPNWPWLTAGVVIGALFALLLIVAHSWS